MKHSLIQKEIIPFLLLFVLLITSAILIDSLLHLFDLMWIGRWLGVLGTLFILLSLGYSMRKRKIIHVGKPKTLLRLHETFTLLGAMMILVHAGVHFYAILPWLALTAMMVSIISGMTGRYLLNRSQHFIIERKAELATQPITEEDEKELFWDSVAIESMKKWRTIHFPITFIFGVLSLTHILTILLYWEWK
jgi:hypothetical protein